MNFTGRPRSAFNYFKVRIRLRCACGEYTTAWASDYDEELALPAVINNHKKYELCGTGYTHEAEFLETGEVRPVLV